MPKTFMLRPIGSIFSYKEKLYKVVNAKHVAVGSACTGCTFYYSGHCEATTAEAYKATGCCVGMQSPPHKVIFVEVIASNKEEK